jgi:hypothetical protein
MNDAMDVEIPLDPPLPKGEDLGLPFRKGVAIQFPPFRKDYNPVSPLSKRGVRGDLHKYDTEQINYNQSNPGIYRTEVTC